MSTSNSSGWSRLGATLLAGLLLWGCAPGESASLAQPLGTDAELLTSAVQIADPHRARYPGNSLLECFARSIWDLHTFEGRIYIGGGDSWNNTGATAVWSLEDDGASPELRLETVVDDEQVALFRDDGDKLYVPGTDAIESWELGNFYVKQAGAWQKMRTVPNALHVWDLAPFQGKLYAFIGEERGDSLLESTDQGVSWKPLPKKVTAGTVIPFDDALLSMGNCYHQKGCVSLMSGGQWKSFRVPVPTFWAARSVRFGSGVLYTDSNHWLPYFDYRPPLYFLGVPAGPYLKVADFGDHAVAGVRDVLVEGDTAFVLTAARHPTDPAAFVGRVYCSSDLRQWSKLAEFNVPAPPYSLARLGGRFYVGLGSDGVVGSSSAVARPMSGTIWRLQ